MGEQAGQAALHDVIMRALKASAKQRLVVFNKTTQITACQGDKMLEAKSLLIHILFKVSTNCKNLL